MKTRIFYIKPSITELEVRYATDAAANGWGEKTIKNSPAFMRFSACLLSVGIPPNQ